MNKFKLLQFLNAFSPTRKTDSGNVILHMAEQFSNADFPMIATRCPRKTSVNSVQAKKAPPLILVTDDGISILFNELHLAKVNSPMLVTVDGIARLANELHPSKAPSPMLVTDDGIVTLVT